MAAEERRGSYFVSGVEFPNRFLGIANRVVSLKCKSLFAIASVWSERVVKSCAVKKSDL